MDLADDSLASFFSHASTVSITETEIEAACRNHAGVFTRRMLEDGRRVRKVEQEVTTEQVSPRKRRFYAMTVDDQGREKALDGLWIDKLQEILDEANRAYGGKNDWQDQVRSQEQNELKTQIHNNFTNFFQCGSESIDSVMDKLSQVWKTLSSEKEIDVPSDLGDLKGSLEAVQQSLKEAHDKGCGYAERVTRQWFAYISKEVFNVERFGNIEIKDLDGLKHRLNLLRMYDELNERWHRMDALNAGLEEAVRSKTALQASVESAELLLVKQVEAEYQKSFERETRQMVMKVAKQRAETAAQVESCLRYRVALRSELLRILTELSDKLRQWHEKLCKKYSDAIRQLKIGKKKMEENLRAAEQKLRLIEEKKASTQSSLATLLKPYAGAAGASNLDPYGDLPKRDELVVKIYALVAALEEPMVSPIIFDAVQRLISRSPHEKMERVVENLTPTKEGQQCVLDFARVQQLLQYTSAARANEDLAPFLAATSKYTPLLLRGPDQVRLAEILKEYREALVDRNSHASAKLLFVAEPFLKLLSKLKEEQQDDSVAAEVGLVLAMANFGAVTRVQRGCQLMAAILNLRSLQLRKHALNRILSEPFPGPTSEDMSAQVRTIDATYRSIEGGVGVLRNQAQSLAKDAANLLKVYGKQIDELIQVIKRLVPRAHQDHQGHGSGRRMSQNADFGCVDSSPRRKQESIAHLPALLAYQKGSESPTDIMTILQYQKILLKLQLQMRKWLRSTCSPNLPQDELSQTEDALQVMQKFISKRHPDYQESVHESALSESSAADSPCPESPKRRSASVDVGKVWNVGNVGWEREISQTSRPSEGHTEKTEGEDDADGTASVGPPKWRRWSDILHDRPNQAQVSQLASAFQEHLQQSRKLVDDSSSSSEQVEVSEVREDSPRTKEMRSKATFLNWVTSGRPASSRTQKKGRMKGLALTAKRHSTKPRQKPQAKPKLEPEDPSRVYMDLMGRHVLQPEEPEASEVQSEASEASEYSESDDGDQMHSPVAQRILLEAVEAPRVVPQRVQKHARTRTSSEEVTLVVGDGHTSPKPGRLALSPTGELMRGKGRLFSPTVQAETSKFRLEGVRVSQCEAKRKASADTEDDVSATSSEEVPEEVSEPQDTGFSRMRTPTLVKDGFLLVDDAAAEEDEEGEVDERDRDDIEADEAAKKPQTDRNHLHLRQPSRDASPGSKSSQSVRSPSRKSRSSMARQEDDSPEARSLGETTRWLQDVLESERHSSAKPLLPRTGRAFPSSSNEYTCAGPPGTARRLRLHQRPTSQPAKPVQEELEEEPVAEEVQSWRCLPKEPGGDWKLLAGSPQGDQEMQAAPVPRMATTSTEEEAEANQMQVVRISSMEFPLPRPGAAAMNIMNQRGKRCLGRARVVVSHSNCELQPSPSSSNASDVETLEDEMGSDAPQFAASTPDRQITPEAAVTSNAVADTQPEAAERPQDRELLKHMGPLRKHLPMTRRGVVPLLTPHEVDEVELGQLELLGEAVRDPRNPRRRHLVSGFSGLSTSKPSNPSPGDDVPGGARETAVGATLQRHKGVTLPMATAVKADLDMDCPTGFRTRECVPAAEDDGAEGLVSDPSVPSIPQSRVTLPPRHGVTLEGDAMEELVADLQHLFHDPDDLGSFRPGSQPAVSLRVFAQQAVAAAAEEESPSGISEPSEPSKPSGPLQRASEWSNVESEEAKAGFPPVSTETPRMSKEAAKGSYHSHKTRAATPALRDREGVRQRPALSELVASDRPIAPAPPSAVEDQLKSWSTRPVSAGVGIRGNQTRPPFGSNTPRN